MKNTYSRKFARRQWRQSFSNPIVFAVTRHAGRDNSFRKFTGRCKN